MEEITYGIIGLAMIYSAIHYVVLSFTSSYMDRTGYGKFISIAGIATITLMMLSVMYG